MPPHSRAAEACRGSVRVTLRVLRELGGRLCKPGRLASLGFYEGPVRLRPLKPCDALTVPALYEFKAPGVQGIVETWRTSYQELAAGFYEARLYLRLDRERGAIVATPDYGGWLRLERAEGPPPSRLCGDSG
jgi:hypothetical protein